MGIRTHCERCLRNTRRRQNDDDPPSEYDRFSVTIAEDNGGKCKRTAARGYLMCRSCGESIVECILHRPAEVAG